MNCEAMRYRSVSELVPLANNPRKITGRDLRRLVDSLKVNGFWPHRPLALEERDGRLVVLCGNQRLKAAKRLKIDKVPTVLYSDLTDDERLDLINRDNINNGEFDFDILDTDEAYKGLDFDYIGIERPDVEEEKSGKKARAGASGDESDVVADGEEDDDERASIYRRMLADVLYESDNIYEIPNLLLSGQAGHLELPFSPWGANSRLRKDVATYHFYVDDYRFEALFKGPVKLLLSGCRAVVEPNCSCHDQTPVAWGISLIYKKRWLARYLQECGLKVYADLNVSHKFIEYNKMGIPKGYNAFFTRGLDGWMESLKSDLAVAQEISGLERPNLVVYGGGREIQAFCRGRGLLYVSDFINAKKK